MLHATQCAAKKIIFSATDLNFNKTFCTATCYSYLHVMIKLCAMTDCRQRWKIYYCNFSSNDTTSAPKMNAQKHKECKLAVYSVSQKNPQGDLTFFIFFTNGWEFLINFLHTYYVFLFTLDYKFIFNYPWFGRSYAILSATTKFT